MNDNITNLAVAATIAIPIILIWTFKPEIDKLNQWIKRKEVDGQ